MKEKIIRGSVARALGVVSRSAGVRETKSLLPQSERGSGGRSLYYSGVWGAD